MKRFLLLIVALVCIASADVASAQCPPGGCRVPQPGAQYRGILRKAYAPPGGSIEFRRGPLGFPRGFRVSGGLAR